MHKSGVKRAQELINKFLPEDFLTLLESRGVWDLPYSFQKPAGIKMVSIGPPPKEYNKLHVSLSSSVDSAAVNSNTEEENAIDIQNMQLEEDQQQQTARIAILHHTLLSVMLKIVIAKRINTTVIQVKVSYPI